MCIIDSNSLCSCDPRSRFIRDCSGTGVLDSRKVHRVTTSRRANALIVVCSGTGVSLVTTSNTLAGVASCAGGIALSPAIGSLHVTKNGTCVTAGFNLAILGVTHKRFNNACVLNGIARDYIRLSNAVCTTASRNMCDNRAGSGLRSVTG